MREKKKELLQNYIKQQVYWCGQGDFEIMHI